MARTKGAPTPRSERSRPSIFWPLVGVILPILSIGVRYRIHDGHKMPKHGACVITPNHFSEIDPVVIGIAVWKMGRLPRFLAKASILRFPVVGWLLKLSGQIPVERQGSGTSALKEATDLSEKGYAVIVYPEGSLTRDPALWPMRGKTGAVRLALEQGLPVIPLAHWGTQEVMGRYSKRISFFPRKTVHIKVGDPIDLSAFLARPRTASTLHEATDVVMQAITALLEDLRHQKAPETRWDPAQHDQKETGRLDA